MNPRKPAPTHRKVRHDGWTAERRERFLALLAGGMGARWACGEVGLSHTAAYSLRRRDAAFAREWRAAQRTARLCAEDKFMAMLPTEVLQRMAELSGASQLGSA